MSMRSLTQTKAASSFTPVQTGLLQRKCATCGQHTFAGGECTECDKKRSPLQRCSTNKAESSEVPPIVHEVLRSPGQPLDTTTRSFMESRFGQDFSSIKTHSSSHNLQAQTSNGESHDTLEQQAEVNADRVTGMPKPYNEHKYDFGQVRVHTDARAAASARAVQARAYTIGRDIIFGDGEYLPQSSSGKHLLAHELTHVIQQNSGAKRLQRVPQNVEGSEPAPSPEDKAALDKATVLETEILASAEFKKLSPEAKARAKEIIAKAKTKPLGDVRGQRNYYLSKLKIAITTPFDGTETGKEEYGCSPAADKKNRAAVEKALEIEKRWWSDGIFADVEENAVASGTSKTVRTGQGGKKFSVDRSDPKNIRVLMKVKLNGKADEVASIKKLEDAIERDSHTKGYYLDIVFVDKSGPDVFEFTVNFCEWANSGNWASGPTTLSHEVHHALGLDDRYDYIESHAANRQMNVPMRLRWFAEQMKKTPSPRDPYSKMTKNANPLLAEDVCAVAFEAGAERTKCIEARKSLDPAGIPAL